jgi:hypothetical protein
VRVGDFDVNGTLDWAALSQSTPNLVVALDDGAGGASLVKYIPVPSNGAPAALDTGDIDKDGLPDFVVAVNGSAAAILASSPGQYSPYAPIATVGTAGSIVLTDFTGDGKLDAVVSSSAGATYLTILPGDGTGSFASLASRVATPFLLRELSAGDLTGDGKPDLTGAWGGIAVLTNDGQGGIAEQRSYDAGPLPSATGLGDVNGDGKLDIFAARGLSGGFGAVSVLVQGGSTPAGIQSYGSGTPGCAGTLGLGAVVKPSVGAGNFAMTFTNAPRGALGILVVTDAVDLTGSDPFGVGLKLHLDFFTATQLLSVDCTSDASGAGAAAAPIPNVPALAGASFYGQAVWVEATAGNCSPALANLVASKGLAITIQP